MTLPQQLRKRINFQGEFEELFKDVCESFRLGSYVAFSFIEMGYEDVNIKLTTTKGFFFVKIFAESREDSECLRLINIVKIALDNGVTHPAFIKRDQGYIYRNQYEQFKIRLSVFEFIEGKTFFELRRNPDISELKKIIKIAATINEIGYKPLPIYDSWAIVNFVEELKKARRYLDEKTLKIMDKLKEEFGKVKIKDLPHSLVHGDLISTNLMKDKKLIYCVDFSVANYYPRIIELAVMMCDIMFDPSGKTSVEEYYKFLLSEYGKNIKLTDKELEVLPLFIKLAHAMHVVRGTRAQAKKDTSAETEHWISLGKKGLAQTLKVWK